jgi:hypothetical protein
MYALQKITYHIDAEKRSYTSAVKGGPNTHRSRLKPKRCLAVGDCISIAALMSHQVRFLRAKRDAEMSHAYQLNEAVLHHGQGPQGRVQVEEPKVYTIVQRMPVEADGRLRYRIKSEKIERVVTEGELSYCHAE